MRTAIFGGAFDPPTLAHEAILHHLLGVFTHTLVVPSFDKEDHPCAANYAQRCALMHELSMDFTQCTVLDTLDKALPTVELLARLRHERPGIEPVIVIGLDQAAQLHTWVRPDLLAQEEFYIFGRDVVHPLIQTNTTLNLPAGISSSAFRATHDLALVPAKLRSSIAQVYCP